MNVKADALTSVYSTSMTVSPHLILTPVARSRLLPLIVIVAFALNLPSGAEMSVTSGTATTISPRPSHGTVVPFASMNEIVPVTAISGTVTVSDVPSALTSTSAVAPPPNITPVTRSRSVPVIVRVVVPGLTELLLTSVATGFTRT